MKSILFGLFLTQSAHAFTTPQYGPYLDAGGIAAIPVYNADWSGGATLSGGLWFGNYDSVYAMGKYTSLGLTTNLTHHRQIESLVEVRRGIELLVLSVFAIGGGGVNYLSSNLTPTAHLGVGIKRRHTPHLGWSVRLEGVTAFAETPSTQLQISLTGSFARPWTIQQP